MTPLLSGSQIEAWMSNETLTLCTDESLSGGAVPQDYGRLFYGMVAPFANYSLAGWVWYQGKRSVLARWRDACILSVHINIYSACTVGCTCVISGVCGATCSLRRAHWMRAWTQTM